MAGHWPSSCSRGGDAYQYAYDYDNRLTQVEFDHGGTLTQLAHWAYDALGRVISAQMRYAAAASGVTGTLNYYYDGQNIIAEYDPEDNLSSRHVHGTSYLDERAVLIEGAPAEADTYYYLLQDLYTVTGMIKANGVLAEAYVYDVYGKLTQQIYKNGDFDREGDVDAADVTTFAGLCCQSGQPTTDPNGDLDLDGDVDSADQTLFNQSRLSLGPVGYISTVGNPYHFTGRRLFYVEDLAAGGAPPPLRASRQLQSNRARF